MTLKYRETPCNYERIEPYVMDCKEKAIESICLANKILFYDACSIMYHSKLSQEKKGMIFSYYLENGDVIIITRTILMELSSEDGNIKESIIEYIKELNNSELLIIIFDEEWTKNCLEFALALSNDEKNNVFKKAFNILKKSSIKFKEYAISIPREKLGKYLGGESCKEDLFYKIIPNIRCIKSEKDSLGEDMIYMCAIILADIVGGIIVISDDRKAVKKITSLDTRKLQQSAHIKQYSTIVIAQYLYRTKKISIEDARDIMKCAYDDKESYMMTFASKEIFIIDDKEFTIDEIVGKLEEDIYFRIFY